MTCLALLALSHAVSRLSLWGAMALITMLYAWLIVPMVAFCSGSYLAVWLAINISLLYSLLAIHPSKAVRLLAFVMPAASTLALALGKLLVLPIGSVLSQVLAMHSLVQLTSTIAVVGAAIALESPSATASSRATNLAI